MKSLAVCFALVAPVLLMAPLQAQRASLTGTVVDSITGNPLQGVSIVLIEMDLVTATDREGAFRFLGIPSGIHTVHARGVGYEAMAVRFQLNAEAASEVALGRLALAPVDAIELDPIEIEARMIAEYPQLEGFFRRMQVEQGTFFTEEDIRRENPRNTSDLVRKLPGFNASTTGRVTANRGVSGLSSFMGGCEVEFFINGVHANPGTLDAILPEVIVGMEIYSGSSTIPHIYQNSSINARCGVVAVWTRHTRREGN